MALLEVHRDAICRITSSRDESPKRGTGFLIGQTHVLTAFHVVGDRRKKRIDPGPFRLEFGERSATRRPWPTTITDVAAHVKGDAPDDWALLTLEETPPKHTVPLALANLPRGYQIPWFTWGFSDAAPNTGFEYNGTITGLGRDLQLFTQQALEKQASRVSGLSGSPCLVDGAAVGIIIAANDPEGAGYAAGGTVFAVPMRAIASKCPELQMPVISPPFVPEVAGYLGGARLKFVLIEVADALGLKPDAIEDVRLPLHVAGRMLADGFDTTVGNVLRLGDGLDRADAIRILDCAGSLWVDATAASMVEEEAASGACRPIGLNLARVDSAARYVHRAGYKKAGHPGWRQFALQLLQPKTERQLRGLIDGVKALLRQKFQCDDDQIIESLKQHPHTERPIFILVPTPVPFAGNISRLKKAFRQVNFVFLLGTPVTGDFRAAYPELKIIEPLLGDGIETLLFDNYRQRNNEIEAFYRKPELPA